MKSQGTESGGKWEKGAVPNCNSSLRAVFLRNLETALPRVIARSDSGFRRNDGEEELGAVPISPNSAGKKEGPGFPGPGSSKSHPISKFSLAEASFIVKGESPSRKPRFHPLWKTAAFFRIAGVGVEPTFPTYRMAVLPLDDPAVPTLHTAVSPKMFRKHSINPPVIAAKAAIQTFAWAWPLSNENGSGTSSPMLGRDSNPHEPLERRLLYQLSYPAVPTLHTAISPKMFHREAAR